MEGREAVFEALSPRESLGVPKSDSERLKQMKSVQP